MQRQTNPSNKRRRRRRRKRGGTSHREIKQPTCTGGSLNTRSQGGRKPEELGFGARGAEERKKEGGKKKCAAPCGIVRVSTMTRGCGGLVVTGKETSIDSVSWDKLDSLLSVGFDVHENLPSLPCLLLAAVVCVSVGKQKPFSLSTARKAARQRRHSHRRGPPPPLPLLLPTPS